MYLEMMMKNVDNIFKKGESVNFFLNEFIF